MAYSPYYDSYGRPRRNSFGYRSSTPSSYYDPLVTKPYYGTSYSSYRDPYGTSYSDPLLLGEYSRSAYPLYASSNHSSHYIPSPYSDSYLDDRIYPPVVQSMSIGRPRSSLSYRSRSPFIDPYRGRSTPVITFKRKGAFMAGISLGEAQANVKLAGSDSYTYSELGVDHRGKIYVRIIWPGYTPLNYEIPVDGYGGRVDLQSLTRRIGRAVTHYLQANVVPVPWNRVEIQQLEAIGIGSWLLKMTTN